MALTKITTGLLADDAVSTASLADGILQAAHLHSSHGITTSNIAEGSNEYHTTARARAAVSVGGSLTYNSSTGVVSFTQRTDGTIRGLVSVTDSGGDGSLAYNNSTGVITYTGPSAAEVRAHISAGTGIAISSGAISSNDSAIVHDSLSGFVANEHLDWTQDQGGTNIHAGNYTDTNTTYTSSSFTHDDLTGFVANEHIDWTSSSAGTIHLTNLPAIGLTTVQTAANQSAMLALTTQEGDVVVRSDELKTYMHNGGSAGTMSDFTLLATPADAVTSVDGATGVVTLNHDSLTGFVANEHIDWTGSSAGTIHATNIANDSIDSQHYAAGSIDNEHIADDAINSEHYAAGSIDNEHIADDAIDSAEIADGAIDLAHMSVNSIDSDQYVDGSIDLAHMSVNSIDSDQYVDGSIDTAHIAASNITNALMADDAVGIAELSATGTASSSTYLRGDNAWTAISSTPSDITITANQSTNENVYLTFVDGATGTQELETDTALYYNPATDTLFSPSLNGNLTGVVVTVAQPYITSVGTLTSFRSTGIDDNADALAITIDSSENVGIGQTSPSAPLHITASGDCKMILESGSTEQSIVGHTGGLNYQVVAGDSHTFVVDGADKFQLHSSGAIGIGGANYGTDGQILTSGGSGAAVAWEDAAASGPSTGKAMVLAMVFG